MPPLNSVFNNSSARDDSPGVRSDSAARLLDLGAAFCLLLLCAPVLLWAAAAVKLTSPGPVFYRQERVGRGGGLFQIWKLRTMFAACGSEPGGPSVTAQDDTRITPLGRHLRSWKVDELPQLFNVLRGEMSLVGPRPQVPRFVDCFEPSLRRVALSVRPGMTGPAALFFRHEEFLLTGQPDREWFYIRHILPIKLQMDAEYVRRRSPAYDRQVLQDTLRLVLSRVTGRAGRSGIPTVSELSALHSADLMAEVLQQTAELTQMTEMAIAETARAAVRSA